MLRKTSLGFLLLWFASFMTGWDVRTVIADQPGQEQEAAAQQQPAPVQQAPAQTVHTYKPTAEDAARPNPMKFTTNSVARGKKVYDTQCAMCHGEAGTGNGDVAKDVGAKPPDFTNSATLKDRTDGELFAIIGAGSGLMPAQGERMKGYHKWDVINYIRSLSGRVPAKSLPGEFDPDHPTVVEPQPPK
ncbi:MAG TPA: cytochrome c [Terriglobia bacterium]|nr:cytochrome c [Terriglobia bacterium]